MATLGGKNKRCCDQKMAQKYISNVGIAMSYTSLIFDGWNPTHKNGDDWDGL